MDNRPITLLLAGHQIIDSLKTDGVLPIDVLTKELMIDMDGKSSLKAIVAQCLASILRWEISVIPSGLKQEKMFDLDLYSLKTDEQKKLELRSRIEGDEFLSYIVNAIKYAAGESV